MKKYTILFSLSLIVLFIYSCQKQNSNTSTAASTVYLDLPATASQYYVSDSDNVRTTLGRVLFYDAHLSLNNATSCGSCHKQMLGFADNVALSKGFQGVNTKRNTPAIQNIASITFSFDNQFMGGLNNAVLFWDGRENNLVNMMMRPVSNHVEMGLEDLSTLPAKLTSLPYYGKLFWHAFGDSTITSDRISKCLAMFSASISTQKSRFDQYQAGNTGVFTAQEEQGMNLFVTKYNCTNCHHVTTSGYGGMVSDFKDIGLDQNYADMGRGTITGNSRDNGTFKVPSLRNVGLTAPYMHDGRFATLGDVIDHYSHGIKASQNLDTKLQVGNKPMQMNITDQEKQSLIAFLNTFTDYNVTVDPKFSNPFKVK
jgi:cytochrome c peroxidase